MFVSHILLHRFFVVGFIIGGLSEIFMRDELMTFPLEFDLLMIGVCTFIKKKKTKKTKKMKKKNRKKECKDMFVSHILLHRFFVVGFIIGI